MLAPLQGRVGLKKIVFCGHAEDKFTILEEHGFIVSRGTVEATVKNPDKIVVGYGGRKIAQKAID